MQNYSFEKLGIDAAYLAFDVNVGQTAKALEAFRTLNVGGFNVTMPCKTEVARLVDRLSPAAELIGACNTVVVEEDGTMTGHITDGTGFVRNLKEHSVEVKDQKIVVLGTGGAATAIAVQAALDGVAEIAIFNRKDEFFANYDGRCKKTILPSYEYLRWKEGLYCFDDVPFSGILDKLEKYYNVKITVTSPRLLTHEGLTGKFREQDGIEHILRAISKEHPFKFRINENKDSIIIYE